LVYQQKEDYARLSELKRRLAEKNEARIKEAWTNDAGLRTMQQDLAIKERRQSAAASAGMTREADKLKDEIASLNKEMDARRDLLVTADVYAPEISSLQQFIEENLRRMEDARARNDDRMRRMLEELATSAPRLASLPAEQKSLAGELEKRSAELNAARERYATAMATATASADEQIATLDKELSQLQAKVDARKKQVTDTARAMLTAEQQRTRETSAAQTRQRLAVAKQAETAARAEYAASQQKLTALETDTAATEATRPQYHAAMNKIAELRRVQQEKEAELADLAKARDHDAAVMPLPPTEASVVVTQTPDRRREAIIFALAVVAVVFVFLIGRARRQAADWEAMAPPEVASDRETPDTEESLSSEPRPASGRPVAV
jgi:chromosome segregation ATPase